MSLNCLNCQVLERTDSDVSIKFKQCNPFAVDKTLCRRLSAGDRNWPTGNLNIPPASNYEKEGSSSSPRIIDKKKKQQLQTIIEHGHHRRVGSTGSVDFGGDEMKEPKLVRSGGMRRDWSFENLRDAKRKFRR